MDISTILSKKIVTLAGAEITGLKIILFIVVLIAAYLISRFIVRRTIASILERRGVKEEARYSILRLVHYLLMFIGIWAAFNVLGVQLTALLAVAGITGIVLGFGLQPIIANFISGLIIMGERTVEVGDWVEVGGTYGLIVDSGIRSSTLRTFDNLRMIIPNRDFIEKPLINYSHKDEKIRLSSPVGVRYGSDINKIRDILLEIAKKNEKVLDSPEPRVFFTEFGDSALKFQLRYWISSPRNRQMVKSEINFEIDRRLAEEGITIPFPQRDVWLKEQK